jgi:hypothetical protein
MPDFRTAFINHVSTLRLTIKTRFACQEELDAPVKLSDDDDELWRGWFLPHPVHDQGSCRRSRLAHMANVSIIVAGPPPSAPIAPTHYLDAGALAPVLALPGATGLSFPSIGSLRLEEGPERKEPLAPILGLARAGRRSLAALREVARGCHQETPQGGCHRRRLASARPRPLRCAGLACADASALSRPVVVLLTPLQGCAVL